MVPLEVGFVADSIDRLGLVERPSFVIGGMALQLEGRIREAGRIDIVTTDRGYNHVREMGFEESVDDTALGCRALLEVPAGAVGNVWPIEVMRYWTPKKSRPLLFGHDITYVGYMHRLQEACGIPVADSELSIRWLLERGRVEDRRVAFGGIRSILDSPPVSATAKQLAKAATTVWPARKRS